MLEIDPAHLKPTTLGNLQPGDLFLSYAGSPPVLCVATESTEKELTWLELSTGAFELNSVYRVPGRHVLSLGINAKELTLRIDLATARENYTQHCPGQLLVGDDGPCIAAVWPQLAEQNYRNVIMLDDFSQSSEGMPKAIFDSWALGRVGVDGQWADVVKRLDVPSNDG